MKQTILTCDRCGCEIKEDTPDKACLYCYKTKQENRTDRQLDLCPECYGLFLTDYLTAYAGRMGLGAGSVAKEMLDKASDKRCKLSANYGDKIIRCAYISGHPGGCAFLEPELPKRHETADEERLRTAKGN